jgi:hypothetical protein
MVLGAVPAVRGQEGSRAAGKSDVLLLTSGEQLTGRLEHADSSKVTFRSDALGEIAVDWSKITELRSTGRFAVIPKQVRLRRYEGTAGIPQGTVSMTGQRLTVSRGAGLPPVTVPVPDMAYMIDDQTFQTAVVQNPGLAEGWKGALTAGAALVQATQASRTFTGTVNLQRLIPGEQWLDTRNRTTVLFSAIYGTLTQPGTPKVKTAIYHADFERDEYFTSRLYAFGRAAYDHNFSQGLDLQQDYGAGVGWTAVKTGSRELDFKGSLNYLKQQFQEAEQNQNLFGSTFAQSLNQKFWHGVTFVQQISITPTWNNLDAYAATGLATLTIPVYKRFSLTVGTVDSFLNNPPPGFKKNSFQFTMGVTYTL